MSAVSVLAFGVTCEIRDDGYVPVVQDQLRLPPQEAQALLEAERLKFKERLRSAKPGAVVHGLAPAARRGPLRGKHNRKQMGVDFIEFADLGDGRRVTVRSDRGLGWSWNHQRGPWYGRTREGFMREVRDYFEAEAEDCCPVSPEWVVERLQRLYGVEVDPESVEAALRLPLGIEFGPRLREQLP